MVLPGTERETRFGSKADQVAGSVLTAPVALLPLMKKNSGCGLALPGRPCSAGRRMVSRDRGLMPVFLDRGGVIVVPEFRDRESIAPRRLEDFRLYPEAAASLHSRGKRGDP
jgi:hypothetical protein